MRVCGDLEPGEAGEGRDGAALGVRKVRRRPLEESGIVEVYFAPGKKGAAPVGYRACGALLLIGGGKNRVQRERRIDPARGCRKCLDGKVYRALREGA